MTAPAVQTCYVLNKYHPQQNEQRKARHAEHGDDERIEEIQAQRELCKHAQHVQQPQESKAQERVDEQPSRKLQRGGEQLEYGKQREERERREQRLFRYLHAPAPSVQVRCSAVPPRALICRSR